MTQFVIILENGTLYKNIIIKLGRFFAETNSDIYWYLKENKQIEIYYNESNKPISKEEISMLNKKNIPKSLNSITIFKDEIYYFTTVQNYKH